MATSAEKIAEIKAKKAEKKIAQAETKAMQKLYLNKEEFDNSKNRTTNLDVASSDELPNEFSINEEE